MKRFVLWVMLLAIGLAACTTPTPTATEAPLSAGPPTTPLVAQTPDPCNKSNLNTTIKDYTNLTREFDDTAYVASFSPQAQLVEPVLKLQDVRRRVQALVTPDCLKNLRKYQIEYMNGVITALVHFLGGAKGDQVQAEIAATRSLRQKYDQELVTLLGITLVAPTAGAQPTPAPNTPAATATPADSVAPTATPGAAPAVVTIIQRANLRRGPGTEFDLVATLSTNETASVIGRNAAGDWLQVENAAGLDGKAWLLASLVTISVPIDQLPVVNPP